MPVTVSQSLATSSIHGLQRAALSENVPRTIAWAALFLVGTIGFTVHLTLLVVRYNAKPINTEVSLDSVKFHFPDLYICNNMVASHSRQAEIDVDEKTLKFVQMNLIRFKQILKQKQGQNISLDVQEDIDYDSLIEQRILWSTANQIPWANTKYQTIIQATLNSRTLDMNAFEEVPHNIYHKCFKFLNTSLLKSPKDELKLYLYLDNSQLNITDKKNAEYISRMQLSENQAFDKQSGLFLFFTEPGHYPNEHDTKRLTASSGMHTRIVIESTNQSMISKPTSPCLDISEVMELVNNLQPNSTLSYLMDRHMCVMTNVALHYYQKCGCIPFKLPIPTSIQQNTARCLDMKKWTAAQVVDNWLCIRNLSENQIHDSIHHKCRGNNLCDRNVYKFRWSNAVWPTVNFISSFVENVINKTYSQRIKSGHSVPAWKNVLDAKNATLVTMVRDNVVKVEIKARSHFSTRITQSYAYPAIYLLSDIGGIIGLYLGMSVLSFCEVLEAIMLIFRQIKERKDRKKSRKENEESQGTTSSETTDTDS